MVQPNIVTGAFSNTIEEFGSVIFLCFFSHGFHRCRMEIPTQWKVVTLPVVPLQVKRLKKAMWCILAWFYLKNEMGKLQGCFLLQVINRICFKIMDWYAKSLERLGHWPLSLSLICIAYQHCPCNYYETHFCPQHKIA